MDGLADCALIRHFSPLEDPRIDRQKKHMLIDVVVIAICATLCGGTSFEDFEDFGLEKIAWLKTFLDLRNGIPSHDTFNRVFARIKPQKFLECFISWMTDVVQACGDDVIAIDGKALRRSFDRAKKQSPIYMVSAFAAANGVTLGQIKVDEKSNEITAVPKLLDLLAIRGCIVTMDAMGCQRDTCQKVLDEGADYCIALKGNQGTLHEDVQSFVEIIAPTAAKPGPFLTYKTNDTGHGRIETRQCFITSEIDAIQDVHDWPGLTSIGVIKSVRIVNGEASYEDRYFICSFAADAEKFARTVRSHWAVENDLHWRLDVVMGEDLSRVRKDHAAENLAAVRRAALNMLRREPTKKSVPRKQKKCALNEAYLAQVLSGRV